MVGIAANGREKKRSYKEKSNKRGTVRAKSIYNEPGKTDFWEKENRVCEKKTLERDKREGQTEGE